jgi:hypothetical protein
MRANALRLWLILVLVAGLVVSVVAKKADSPFVGWISFAIFLGAVWLWVQWRRTVAAERRGRVFDRESKTSDETRTGPDR